MSFKKSLKLLLHVGNIALKIGLIYLVARYAYRTLADEDEFYQRRGANTFCQSLNTTLYRSPVDEAVCQQDKFRRFVYLYIDSLPLDLFEYDNKFTGGHSKVFRIRHFGITDSGPVFSSFATGKISNKYEGSIAGLDNLFGQFARAGHAVRAFGYYYPVFEMLGTGFFASYDNTQHGLHRAYCEEFLDLPSLTIEGLSITDSLIFDQAEYFEYLDRRYKHFRGVLRPRRRAIFECLARKFEGGQSHFNYEVYTDTIGHQFSRQSKFYLNKVAALKANLDLFLEFARDHLEDTGLFLLSDHGVVSSLWETEVSNHGTAQDRNESFLFLFSRRFSHASFDPLDSLNSYDVSAIFAQLVADVNLPINYRYLPPLVRAGFFAKFAALRQKEAQMIQFIESFSPEVLGKLGVKARALTGGEALRQLEHLWQLESFERTEATRLVLEAYLAHVRDLDAVYAALLKTNASDKRFAAVLLKLVVAVLFVFLNIGLLGAKMAGQRRALALVVGLFLSLPAIFLSLGRVFESLFVSFNFFLLAVCLLLLALRGAGFEGAEELRTKISVLASAHLLLYVLDLLVERYSFFFLYYQNVGLQALLCVLALLWSAVFLREFLRANRGAVFSRRLRVAFLVLYGLCDVLSIAYELKLMLSFNYFQNGLMIALSRGFYLCFALLVLTHFNFFHKRELLAFVVATKLVFWFGHNYIRLAYYAVLLPAYFLYLRSHQARATVAATKPRRLLRKATDFALLLYHALFVFHITRGRLDTNISVRAGNRNWGSSIEEVPAFTAVLFSVNKFLPFIVTYLLMLAFAKKLKDLRLDTRSLAKAFNCHLSSAGIRLSDVWFGCAILVYLGTFDDPETQRASFMLYGSGLILIVTFYAFALIDSVLFVLKRRTKPKYLPVNQTK